jgi:flavin reductase (DIM6/NTAB) family NADH-FMN oxidoreductase RutF
VSDLPVHLVSGDGEPRGVSGAVLRDVMSQFASGVTVLTTGGEHAAGMTANAFSSVSLDPPLVLCCVVRTARLHDAIPRAGHFGVSILGADQEGVARYFADKKRPSGASQFDEVDWFAGKHTGAPLLAGSLAWLECELAEAFDGGDHSIYLGRVLDAGSGSGPALLFFGSGFHRPFPSAA